MNGTSAGVRTRIGRRRPIAATLVAIVAGALVVVPTAEAGQRSATLPSKGPGPAAFDHVSVEKFGPRKAKRILVLMPGTAGGAGDFSVVARELVKRVPGLGVWAIDRRSQPLEDTAMFESALAGRATPEQAFDYYLGWLSNGGTPADHFQFLDPETVPFAKRWGMKVALQDARKVVRRAGERGRRVLLGGHSLGASLAAAYAAWDFHGVPGFRALDGIVLIDGGLLGSFDAFTREEAEQRLAGLEQQPFLDLLGIGIPEAAGLFAEAGGLFALQKPDESAATLQGFPLLPAEFRPPVEVTNEGLFGYAFDRDTSPQSLSLLHINAGRLAAAGSPRPWVDGGVTPVRRLARTFAQEPANAVEWYFPFRLTIDTNGANQMRQNEVAEFLGLRLEHTNKIDVPVYAFQTDLTDGRVLRGARTLIDRSRTTLRESKLIDGDPRQSHLDPLTAAPETNGFARTVARFIKRATR
jgi:pimeloyl-ACP methyl ester carboxylesterase